MIKPRLICLQVTVWSAPPLTFVAGHGLSARAYTRASWTHVVMAES